MLEFATIDVAVEELRDSQLLQEMLRDLSSGKKLRIKIAGIIYDLKIVVDEGNKEATVQADRADGFMALDEKMEKYETVEQPRCLGCGNAWFFRKPESYECTTCEQEREDR